MILMMIFISLENTKIIMKASNGITFSSRGHGRSVSACYVQETLLSYGSMTGSVAYQFISMIHLNLFQICCK